MDNQPITPEIPPTPSGSFNPDSFGSTTPKSKASVIAIVVILVMITFSIGMFFFVCCGFSKNI